MSIKEKINRTGKSGKLLIFFSCILLLLLFVKLFLFDASGSLFLFRFAIYIFISFIVLVFNFVVLGLYLVQLKVLPKSREEVGMDSLLNENAIIKCDNKYYYIFFNCNYVGRPIKKSSSSFWRKLYFFYSDVVYLSRQFHLRLLMGKKINPDGYICPKCGNELSGRNILNQMNVQNISQSFAHGFFLLVFWLSVFVFIFFTVGHNLMLIYTDSGFWFWTAMTDVILMFVSGFFLLILKK